MPASLPLRLRGFAFAPDAPPRPLASLEELRDVILEKRFAWLDAEGEPGPETEAWLREHLDWHPIVLQNIKQASSRARLTPFEDYTHLSFTARVPGAGAEDAPEKAEVDAILGSGYLITFHACPIPVVDALLEDVPGWKSPPKSPDLLLYRMLAAAVDLLEPEVENLDAALSGLEDEALYEPRPDLLDRIVVTRDALYLLHLSLAPQLQMVHDLTSGASRFVTPYARPFFRSLENRLRGLIDDIAIYREVAQNALELYRSSITHKTNETIRVLTVVSTPLLVLTFVTGLYGMNVPLPFADSPRAFLGIAGISAAVFLGMLAWFRRKHWF
ncbi:MAG: corA [Fibrobacteria bacterium]|jgi:magnesium transporter|nr:corA [Fibrobacteria bacterium]